MKFSLQNLFKKPTITKEEKILAASKRTERAIYTSLISVFLASLLMVGSTFAWYTASITTPVTPITAGTFSVELGLSKETKSASSQLPFYPMTGNKVADSMEANPVWNPGSSFRMEPFTVKNTGDIPMKYGVYYTFEGNSKDPSLELLNVLSIKVQVGNQDPVTLKNLLDFKPQGSGSGMTIDYITSNENVEVKASPDEQDSSKTNYEVRILLCSGKLKAGASTPNIKVTVSMSESAGGFYSDLTVKPTLLLNTIQDVEPATTDYTSVNSAETLAKAVNAGGKIIVDPSGDLRTIVMDEPLVIASGKNVELDMNNISLIMADTTKNAIIVENGAALTLRGARIDFSKRMDEVGNVINDPNDNPLIVNKGTLNIQDGCYIASSTTETPDEAAPDAIPVVKYNNILDNDGTCTIVGGSFYGELDNAKGKTLTIKGGVFVSDPIVFINPSTHRITENTTSPATTYYHVEKNS